MESNEKIQAIKKLMEMGKKKAVLSYKDVEDALCDLELEAEQIENIYEELENIGVEIVHDLDKELAFNYCPLEQSYYVNLREKVNSAIEKVKK